MRVFISWSGEQGKEIGEALRSWLPSVVQAAKPYFSPADVSKGARWAADLAKELESSSVGLIVLTRAGLKSDWIMFEAGALSRSVEQSRVIPLLFGLDPADVSGPLAQFQAAPFGKSQMLRVVEAVNTSLASDGLDGAVLIKVFNKWWPELEQTVATILDREEAVREPVRSEREILDEILNILRTNKRKADAQELDAILRRAYEDHRIYRNTSALSGFFEDDSNSVNSPARETLNRMLAATLFDKAPEDTPISRALAAFAAVMAASNESSED